MEAQKAININNFSNKILMKQSSSLEEKMADELRKNGIPTNNVFFNTKKTHKHLDIVEEVIKYDYLWKNDYENIVAFWDHKSQKLMF